MPINNYITLPELSASAGSSLMGYNQGSTGAATITQQAKNQQVMSVTEFYANGVSGTPVDNTGVLVSTLGIQAALNAAKAAGKSLYFPAGTYLTDALQLPLQSYNDPFWIVGEGHGITKIQKNASDGNPLFTVGSASATAFSTELFVTGITFSGVAGNTPAAFLSYDLVRSNFEKCVFQNSIAGYLSFGGISNSWLSCIFQNNQIGQKLEKFTSLAGGGYPNNNQAVDCGWYNNTLQGVWFNNGRNLNIVNPDIEGNGTSGNSSTMAVYVNNVNSEGGGAAPAIGLTMLGGWVEANSGDAAVQLNSGVNTIRSTYFAANGNATNDIHVVGGNYHLSEVAFGTNKTANLLEGSGSNTGNTIINCFDALVGGFSFNPAKTTVQGAWNSGSGALEDTFLMRSGSVPVVMSTANPMIQTGTATSGAGGAIAIGFTTAYAATPQVYTSIVDASSNKLVAAQVSALTVNGCTITVTSATSGSSTIAGLVGETVQWLAIGATS